MPRGIRICFAYAVSHNALFKGLSIEGNVTSLIKAFLLSHATTGNASIIISSLSHEKSQTVHLSLWLKNIESSCNEYDNSYGFTNFAFGWYPCSRHDEGFGRCM